MHTTQSHESPSPSPWWTAGKLAAVVLGSAAGVALIIFLAVLYNRIKGEGGIESKVRGLGDQKLGECKIKVEANIGSKASGI
jgi:capsular polysaccharide biosynthesis protein